MLNALDVSASALEAQRLRMEVASNNLANAQTTRATRAPDGTWLPYRRRQVVFQALLEGAGGVKVQRVEDDPSDFHASFDPHHPDADAQGMVKLPNVDPLMEMVDLIEASRAYEAGITSLNTAVSMAERAISIGGR